VASATLGGAYVTKLKLLLLLEVLGATRAYCEAVFTEPIKIVVSRLSRRS